MAELVSITKCDICDDEIEENHEGVTVKIWMTEQWCRHHDVCLKCLDKLPEYIRKEHMKNA